ncbi:MAG: CBS domain-containing protein [Deltaproteobacteria bacterium]|nr:CBS domain-containing protein [Deltaproteobacteria bacterium]MDQ3298202.1 CBS domain-containing protein [Myxococcota bacterium]
MKPVAVEVPEETPVETLRTLFHEHRASVLPVVDRQRAFVGLVTARDVAAAGLDTDVLDEYVLPFGSHLDPIPCVARDLMRPAAFIVHEYTTMRRAAQLVVVHNLAHLPVVDRAGRLVGIVSALDVLHRSVFSSGDGVFA